MKLQRTTLFSATILFSLIVLPLARNLQAADYYVYNLNDSGANSLRWAIQQANANVGPDNILFNIPMFICDGSHCTISPASGLPALTDDETTIDGYSQPGASMAVSGDLLIPAVLLIELDGSSAGDANGLNILSADNLVRGLTIQGFAWNGIAIGSATATGNRIEGNHIGTDVNGMVDLGNGMDGVFIGLSAKENVVGYIPAPCTGGLCPSYDFYREERNVISGNTWEGIGIHGVGTTNNAIGYNFIGLDAPATAVLSNTLYGVRIYGGAQQNGVSYNFISGNVLDGVRIAGDGTTGNIVAGSVIGSNMDLYPGIGNGGNGITITDGAQHNFIVSGYILGNSGNGIEICGMATDNNSLYLNSIGIIHSGSVLGNGGSGVHICDGASLNKVGDCETDLCYGNTISGNGAGVVLTGPQTSDNELILNRIGTDRTGMTAHGNTGNGVTIADSSHSNSIGSATPDRENIISGNGGDGITLSNSADNQIKGNIIGVNKEGTAILANNGNGIRIDEGSSENSVDSGNVIAGSGGHGVVLLAGSEENIITENYIGTSDSGIDLGNTGNGVYMQSSIAMADNTIGPENVIAWNGNGIVVDGGMVNRQRFMENAIYNNDAAGIVLTGGANGDIAAPVIGINDLNPSQVIGSACSGCTVELFAGSSNDGEGEHFLGSTTADTSGRFILSVSPLPYQYLTATATDLARGTSEFSPVYVARLTFPWKKFIPAIISSTTQGLTNSSNHQ